MGNDKDIIHPGQPFYLETLPIKWRTLTPSLERGLHHQDLDQGFGEGTGGATSSCPLTKPLLQPLWQWKGAVRHSGKPNESLIGFWSPLSGSLRAADPLCAMVTVAWSQWCECVRPERLLHWRLALPRTNTLKTCDLLVSSPLGWSLPPLALQNQDSQCYDSDIGTSGITHPHCLHPEDGRAPPIGCQDSGHHRQSGECLQHVEQQDKADAHGGSPNATCSYTLPRGGATGPQPWSVIWINGLMNSPIRTPWGSILNTNWTWRQSFQSLPSWIGSSRRSTTTDDFLCPICDTHGSSLDARCPSALQAQYGEFANAAQCAPGEVLEQGGSIDTDL